MKPLNSPANSSLQKWSFRQIGIGLAFIIALFCVCGYAFYSRSFVIVRDIGNFADNTVDISIRITRPVPPIYLVARHNGTSRVICELEYSKGAQYVLKLPGKVPGPKENNSGTIVFYRVGVPPKEWKLNLPEYQTITGSYGLKNTSGQIRKHGDTSIFRSKGSWAPKESPYDICLQRNYSASDLAFELAPELASHAMLGIPTKDYVTEKNIFGVAGVAMWWGLMFSICLPIVSTVVKRDRSTIHLMIVYFVFSTCLIAPWGPVARSEIDILKPGNFESGFRGIEFVYAWLAIGWLVVLSTIFALKFPKTAEN